MSYRELLYDGQLWAAEKMLEENPEDSEELAALRHATVKILNYLKN